MRNKRARLLRSLQTSNQEKLEDRTYEKRKQHRTAKSTKLPIVCTSPKRVEYRQKKKEYKNA